MLNLISRKEINIMINRIEKALNNKETMYDFGGTTITPLNLRKFLEEHYCFRRVRGFLEEDNVTYIEQYEGNWKNKNMYINIHTDIELFYIEIVAGEM